MLVVHTAGKHRIARCPEDTLVPHMLRSFVGRDLKRRGAVKTECYPWDEAFVGLQAMSMYGAVGQSLKLRWRHRVVLALNDNGPSSAKTTIGGMRYGQAQPRKSKTAANSRWNGSESCQSDEYSACIVERLLPCEVRVRKLSLERAWRGGAFVGGRERKNWRKRELLELVT